MAGMLEDERFDGMLLSFAQQCNGIEPLLDTVFSFLRRKVRASTRRATREERRRASHSVFARARAAQTDFFTGADPEVAKATILKVLDKHQSLAERTQAAKLSQREKEERKAKSAREAVARKQREKEESERKKAKDVVEMSDDGAFEITSTPEPEPGAITEEDAATPGAAKEDGDDADKDDDDKEPPPPGNGMVLDNYSWTQQLSDLQVTVPVPPGTKSRMLNVDIRKNKLTVGLKGQPPLMDGELHKAVIVEDCMWTLEDSKEISISLQKEDKMNWWKCVMVGDPEINTQKVQPENSKLSDLDGETRMTVEKMMFDQRQKALGKPSADEMQKQNVLEKFMKQHPEMDFSKAKMC